MQHLTGGCTLITRVNVADLVPVLGGLPSLLWPVSSSSTSTALSISLAFFAASLARSRFNRADVDRERGYRLLAHILCAKAHLIDQQVLRQIIELVEGERSLHRIPLVENLHALRVRMHLHPLSQPLMSLQELILNATLWLSESVSASILHRLLRQLVSWIAECPLAIQVRELGHPIQQSLMPDQELARSYNAAILLSNGLANFLLQILSNAAQHHSEAVDDTIHVFKVKCLIFTRGHRLDI